MAPAPSQQLHLQLMGPVRLRLDDHPVHIGSRKALALLAMLALDQGGRREQLAALLWPEVTRAAARRSLRGDVFRLRRLGVPIAEMPDGGLALGSQVQTDVEGWINGVRTAASAEVAMEGLDGVSSPDFDVWLGRWRERLVRRRSDQLNRLAAQAEDRGELALAMSLHDDQLLADPCNEAAAMQLMRLQAGQGHHTAALQVYRRLADALQRELDTEPSAATQALAQALRGAAAPARATPSERLAAPDLAAPADTTAGTHTGTSAGTFAGSDPAETSPAASSLPAVPPYVPRRAAQLRIDAAWSRGQRVYLHGPAGTGKTRLASEMAAARGPWLRVACDPQDADLPYASVLRLLRALRESAPHAVLPDWVRRELAQLMPELGTAPLYQATDEARQRLLTAVAEAWRLLMDDNFSVLVLDDWQWCDAASVDLWSRLEEASATSVGPDRVAWVIVYRSAQLPAKALERQRADIDNRHAVTVALGGMDRAEVRSLVQALSGSASALLFAQRLHGATQGNPFFLLETLRHLFEQGLLVANERGWSTLFDERAADFAELPVPDSVRAAVLSRVRALGSPLQRLLQTASLAGSEIDLALMAAVTGTSEEVLIGLLEHALAAQLIEETTAGWRFAHDLVRQSVAQSLSAGRRRLLHEHLARQLERVAAPAAVIARHWEAAQRPAQAVPWRVAAAEAALTRHALVDALAHNSQALANGASGVVAARLHLAMAQIHARHTDRRAADLAFDAALAAAAAGHPPEAATVLAIQLDRADHLRETDRVEASVALIESLQADLLDAPPALRAHALAARGSACMLRGKHQEAQSLMRAAIELLDPLAEARPQLASLLLELTRVQLRSGDLAACAALARRAIALHESIDAPVGLARSLVLGGLAHLYRGEYAEARQHIQRARLLAQHCGDVPTQRGAILNLVKLDVDIGDTDAATALLDEGEALAPGFEHRRAELAFLEARYFLHFLRGEMAPAHAAAERLLALATPMDSPHERIGTCQLVVDLYLLDGRLEHARGLLGEAQVMVDTLTTGIQGTPYAAQQAIKQAWLSLAEHRPKEALALLPPTHDLQRMEDRFLRAWVGCAAARDAANPVAARQYLQSVELDADVAMDVKAPWLAERLALASDCGLEDAAALRLAEQLIGAGRIPVPFLGRLRQAMAAHRQGSAAG